jgi:hypothetical protein
MNRAIRCLAAVICFASFAVCASATTISGVVNNGTSGKPAAGVDVILMNLQGGMDTVANTKTDAQGRYQLSYTPAGQTPMLVRAVYKGVNFHAMLPPGSSTADIKVYDPTTDVRTLGFPTRIIIFQPDGANLLIGEEYEVQNQANPPVAYFKMDGNFEFKIPEGTDLKQVSAAGPENMSVVQGTMNRGANHYAIAFAFRPGESQVRLTYSLPYPENKASLHIPSVYAAGNVILLAPPTVTVTAPGFQPAASQQGMSVYSRDSLAAGSTIDVSLSGTAPPPSNGSDAQGQGDPSQGNGGRDAGAAVTAVPPRMDSIKWVLAIGFAALFLLGGAYLMRRPLPAASPATGSYSAPPPMVARPPDARTVSPSSASHFAPATGASLGDIDRKVGASLDELKDTLFKLELRHQAGTISEQEYAEQRARAEKILRDLVRG